MLFLIPTGKECCPRFPTTSQQGDYANQTQECNGQRWLADAKRLMAGKTLQTTILFDVSAKSGVIVRSWLKKILQFLPVVIISEMAESLQQPTGHRMQKGKIFYQTKTLQAGMFWQLFHISNRNHHLLSGRGYVIFGPSAVIGFCANLVVWSSLSLYINRIK